MTQIRIDIDAAALTPTVLADVTKLAADLAGAPVASGTQTSSGTSPAPAAPTGGTANAYPLQMPSGITNGEPVTLGAGPNAIVIYVANTPGQATPAQFAVLGTIAGKQTALAGPLTVTSYQGEAQSGSQVFTIRGDFSGLTEMALVSAGTNGIVHSWVNQLTVDLIPWWTNGDAINSRGTGTPVYVSTRVFNSNGDNEVWLPQSAIPASAAPTPAAPPPALTLVSGATINGAAHAAATLQDLVSAIPAGGSLVLPAGTVVGTAHVPVACTISGAGQGKTIIDATGVKPVYGKGVIVPDVAGVVISGITVKGASISTAMGENAAGARDGATGVGLTLAGMEITGCQDGVLTFASNIALKNGTTHDNGAGNALTHEIYIGGPGKNAATFTDWVSKCGALSTHALKSRAGTTVVDGGSYTGSADPVGKIGGSVVNIANGGVVQISNTTITVSAGAANRVFLDYGLEGAENSVVGDTVTLTNVHFVDDTGQGGIIACGATNYPNATLVLSGCTYTGTVAPSLTGWKTVSGAITKAA